MAEKKEKKKKSIGEMAMWVLMGLLILGLGGFGVDGVINGSVTRVARVGDKDVDINSYARALQQQLQQVSQRAGRGVTFAQAQESGLDRIVLEQLMNERALDHEAAQMGISIGDENLRDQIVGSQTFQGLDGTFDREGYAFALQNAGMTEAQFEARQREEIARTILQGAVASGIVMPDTFAQTIVDYVGETRNFTFVRLDDTDLEGTLEAPDEATLRAYYDSNIDDFQLPEAKRITYAILRPEDLIDEVEVSQDSLQEAYDARSSEFNQPERRLVERLVYLDEASAEAAAAQLDVGTTFETLVSERGLSLQDIDLGDVSKADLEAAGEAVFAAEVGAVVGPLPSSLGPALFRVNGVLPAQNQTLEDVSDLLRRGLAADAARRLVAAQAASYDDLLAGGATLEELATETDMELGTIDWSPALGEGIAAYDRFRVAAAVLSESDFPEIETLTDGSVYAMRLDEVLPQRPKPFDAAREAVQTAWEADRAERLLSEEADAIVPELEGGKDFADLGLDASVEENLDRGAFVEGTTPEFMSEVFAMEVSDISVIAAFGAVHIVRLDAINPASDNPDSERILQGVSGEITRSLAQDVFGAFASDAMLRAGREIDARALEAVHANFR